MTKYYSVKTTVDGIKFDSKKEAARYKVLKKLEEEGEITDLAIQQKFVLIPAQRAPKPAGKNSKTKLGKTVERECSYIADFTYVTKKGELIVEDCKGVKTPEYKIKRKLMLWLKGIKILET